VYYFSAYADLLKSGEIAPGDEVNFAVPTGNFGNILACYYASRMGLPVGKLICASNANNVLTEFFNDGVYDRRRPFRVTSSPAMDILISSNLERLLFEIASRDSGQVSEWMELLSSRGVYGLNLNSETINTDILNRFWAAWASEDETISSIKHIWDEYHYLIDTHTAVGFDVLQKYRRCHDDNRKTIVTATASPFKFNEAVASAVMPQEEIQGKSEFELLDLLSAFSRMPVPKGLVGLSQRISRYNAVCRKDDMKRMVLEYLDI
jgi:threonine synthase